MRKLLAASVAGVLATTLWIMAVEAEVISLRGASSPDAASEAFDRRKQTTAEGGFKRSWKTQPPMIPHKIDRDRITLKQNTCLNCHGVDNYKKEKSPKAGDSHYVAADGTKQDSLDMRRYFCSQCHVPLTDAKPLVENVFESGPK